MLKKFYKIIILPYTLCLLYLMLLGFGRTQYDENVIRIKPFLSTLMFIENTFRLKTIIIIVLGNIIMFIPFGFLGWIFPRLNDLKSLVFTFVSIITIVEALQYFTRMGIFEVDDIMMNTFGVFIGWNICKFLEKRFNRLVL
ncbi:VanZ family protein [Chryseobacterium oryctis]|uniref:VanZ family protein n=1 Tax=Chryseobacterium oryctis TaxID=2952618 RepID=A0ABT3HJU1_9FLAO|nr:VanZ family protein [Chryseobacterium oryctis]MCW3160034.1 VanZ family protein [Chryseobacterium oryctis]